jgi:hypothetical protein
VDGGANEDVRGEAARLRRRLGVARGRLDALLQAAGDPGTGGVGDAAGGDSAARGGLARIDDDDEVRALLRPAADRIARLLELTDGLADGTLSEASAGDAARAVADTQPFRRPR